MDEWERGALMFASVLVAAHDQPTMAADVLHELGLGNADCSGLEAYDKRNLRKLQGERGGLIRLRGLGGRKAPNTGFKSPAGSA